MLMHYARAWRFAHLLFPLQKEEGQFRFLSDSRQVKAAKSLIRKQNARRARLHACSRTVASCLRDFAVPRLQLHYTRAVLLCRDSKLMRDLLREASEAAAADAADTKAAAVGAVGSGKSGGASAASAAAGTVRGGMRLRDPEAAPPEQNLHSTSSRPATANTAAPGTAAATAASSSAAAPASPPARITRELVDAARAEAEEALREDRSRDVGTPVFSAANMLVSLPWAQTV